MSFEDQIISVLLHYSLEINCNVERQKKKKSEKRFTLIIKLNNFFRSSSFVSLHCDLFYVNNVVSLSDVIRCSKNLIEDKNVVER